jgi:hypothetical protein
MQVGPEVQCTPLGLTLGDRLANHQVVANLACEQQQFD